MANKPFFNERTVPQIRALKTRKVYNSRNLARIINEIDPAEEAVEIRTQILPRKFTRGKDSRTASRKALKDGDCIKLMHPKSKAECYDSPLTPLKMRLSAFRKELEGKKEHEVNFLGYFVHPQWGDRMKRFFPFVHIAEGVRFYAFSQQSEETNIKVEDYSDARRAEETGASVVVSVPSRTEGSEDYNFRLDHVPLIRSQHNLATVLSLRQSVLVNERGEPIKGRTPHQIYSISYKQKGLPTEEATDVVIFYPHDFAAYMAIARDQMETEKNLTPWEMNPFPTPSKHQAEFYKKMLNNVLIYDPSLKSKHKLRKPHLAEISLLLARGTAVFGHDNFAFWDASRDGKLRDYDWSIPGE